MSKFFCLPNLATDHASVSSEPWNEFPVSGETLALPKDEYKKRWFTPDTRHCLFSLCEGQNGAFVVSQGNQCSMIHGFAADFDGVFTPDIIEASKSKEPSRFRPKWWSVSQSGGLHLVWVLDRPIAVAGNAHANELLHVIATKLRVVRWGVGYDPDSEKCTQVMDIGREWHEFDPNGRIPTEEVIAWDAALFESKSKKLVDEVVDIPFDVVSAEIKKREWPLPIPERIDIGTLVVAVVQVQCRRREVRLQGVAGIGQVGQFDGHGPFLFVLGRREPAGSAYNRQPRRKSLSDRTDRSFAAAGRLQWR